MQQQLQQVQLERAVYIKQIEADHPGYEWDEQRGLMLKDEAYEMTPEFTQR